MKKRILIALSAAALVLTSCSKLGELTADNFKVTPNPLETDNGKVTATINGMFPEKYMKKKATVTVIPELRYANGQVARGASATFQGEKVRGNNQEISYRLGGTYTMKTSFNYVPEMQKSEMYLTFDAKIGKKSVEVPAVKVANGVIATSELYKSTLKNAQACIAPDAFQRVTVEKQEANIKFLIQQTELRKSELKNNSIKEFVSLLKRINEDKETLNLNNIEISAYASPDGGYSLNNKIANQRQLNAEKYVEKQLKEIEMDSHIEAKYTAQDWEGFQELVKASNIQDKEVILRVLSMYKDPEEREKQIKNMSEGFQELADGILPELRRARLTINYEVIGRDDEQIQNLLKTDAKQLSVEELLYAAILTEDKKEQMDIYQTTTKIYPKDARAYNNIATLEFANGNYSAAKQYAQKALSLNSNCKEANANLGLIALANGDLNTAEGLIAKAADANGIAEVLGNLNLAKGNYAQAEYDMRKVKSNSAALAQILNKNYNAAIQTLNNVPNANGTTEYLKAIVYARQGNNSAAATALKNAIAKDPSLASYASNDLELAKVSK